MSGTPRVLHVLSQRPGLTGSGTTLDALCRGAARTGWDQWAVVGVPAAEPETFVGGLHSDRIRPLRFGDGALPFDVPGMSDVMPYNSTRFSDLDEAGLEAYRGAWRAHLESVIADVRPDVIHAHHVWLVGAMLKDVAPDVPVVTHCHATGFRQMNLCPHLAAEVRDGCRRNDAFCALHAGHASELKRILGVSDDRIHVVGAGYREDVFHARGAEAERGERVAYVGKLSSAKGLPWLLDAVEILRRRRPGLELHVAGSGAGDEAESLKRRMEAMDGGIVLHGQLSQLELAEVLRGSAVCVLPSFYEGVPLVLVEALACGCRLVSTRLPGVVDRLAPSLGEMLSMIPLPRMETVDVPHEPDLPAFTAALAEALDASLAEPPVDTAGATFTTAVGRFAWASVFDRVQRVWHDLL